jgi:type VI protein secretion system component Hcp
MRKHLIIGAAVIAIAAAAVGARMAFAGGDAIPACTSVVSDSGNIVPTTCPSYRVEWQLGPPDAFQFDSNQVVGEATLTGLSGAPRDVTFPIYAYNWGVAASTTLGGGGGGGAGRAQNQDFTIVKYVDELTPLLSEFCETGARLPAASVTVKSKTGTMTYHFAPVTCSLDKQGSSGNENSQPIEQFTWDYGTIHWTFTPKGGPAVER